LGSDHDFAQRNSCSDPNPGMLGAARVFCQFMLPAVHYRRDDERLLLARSSQTNWQIEWWDKADLSHLSPARWTSASAVTG